MILNNKTTSVVDINSGNIAENGGIPDYIDKDSGLLFCGKCRTAKQLFLSELSNINKDGSIDFSHIFKNNVVKTMCECEKAEFERRQEFYKQKELAKLVHSLRKNGLRETKALDWTFKNDDGSTPNMNLARKYVDEFAKMEQENYGLLLWGNVGTGKSFFAGCIANALINKGISVCMTNFAMILGDLMDLKINKNEYLKQLNNNRLLIIDDFGMERNTSFAQEQLFNVLNSRYIANKPLIITTNLIPNDMENADNSTDLKRIYDRVLEMCVPIQFKGDSKRQEKREVKLQEIKTLFEL